MRIILSIICLLLTPTLLNAQILFPANPLPGIQGSNVFLDATTNYSTEAGAQGNVGKGLLIPSVDLVNFEFDLTLADGFTFPTYFDGMMVYNNATGTTLNTGDRPSTATAVTPGFYYFSNPDGATNGNITEGVWTPLGGVKTPLSIKTSNYTLTSQDYTVLCNASNSTISLTLPSPSESADKIIIIKKIDTSYNKINFSPSVYLTDSETAISINYPKTIKIQSNGTNWYVIN